MTPELWAKWLTTPPPVPPFFTQEQKLHIYRKAFYFSGKGKKWYEKRENWMLLFLMTSINLAQLEQTTGRSDLQGLYKLYQKEFPHV